MITVRGELVAAALEEALAPRRRRAERAAMALAAVALGMALRRFLGLEPVPITYAIGDELEAYLDHAGL